MNIAILSAILASLLWGITNHIDKFLISGTEDKNNIKVLLVFSTLIAGIILIPIWLILSNFNLEITTISLISIFASSTTYIISTYFFFKAMEKNDATIVVTMSQMTPVFSYILALILFKETLTIKQILGSIIILLSSIFISLDLDKKDNNKKDMSLLLMTISSLGYAIYFILFDIGIRNSSYYSCAFYYQIGLFLIGLILLCITSFRTPFLGAIKRNGKRFFILNTTNEILNLSSTLLVNYANVFLPAALANVLLGFQGSFVFLLGIIGTIIVPKYIKEDLRKKVVIQKIISIILGIIGLIILVY